MNNVLQTPVFWTEFRHQQWSMYLAASSKGLCYVGSNCAPFEELNNWVHRHFPYSPLVEDDEKLKYYVEEMAEYLEGKRVIFSIPLDLRGTAFQLEVWQALCKIQYGVTCSYSDIAELIGRPSSVRAIGTAIGANPILINIPCHRVIGKNGALTGYRGGIDMKISLLKLEEDGIMIHQSVGN